MKTIEVVKGGACTIGQRDGFSDTDVRKINTLYNCDPDKYPNVGGGGVVTSGTTVATTTKFTVRPTPKTTTTFKPSGCGNNHKWCEYWAKTDECNKNPGYMLVNCRKACNQCDKNLNCVDHESHCQDWADNGWCDLLGFYMNKYCPKVRIVFRMMGFTNNLKSTNNFYSAGLQQMLNLSCKYRVVFLTVQEQTD